MLFALTFWYFTDKIYTMKKFTKNDEGFVCVNCNKNVKALNYTSRDHCPYCLCSIHIDILPGDRQNDCKGLLIPVDLEYNQKKGYVIVYKCQKCGMLHKNKVAVDDDKFMITKVSNKTYKIWGDLYARFTRDVAKSYI